MTEAGAEGQTSPPATVGKSLSGKSRIEARAYAPLAVVFTTVGVVVLEQIYEIVSHTDWKPEQRTDIVAFATTLIAIFLGANYFWQYRHWLRERADEREDWAHTKEIARQESTRLLKDTEERAEQESVKTFRVLANLESERAAVYRLTTRVFAPEISPEQARPTVKELETALKAFLTSICDAAVDLAVIHDSTLRCYCNIKLVLDIDQYRVIARSHLTPHSRKSWDTDTNQSVSNNYFYHKLKMLYLQDTDAGFQTQYVVKDVKDEITEWQAANKKFGNRFDAPHAHALGEYKSALITGIGAPKTQSGSGVVEPAFAGFICIDAADRYNYFDTPFHKTTMTHLALVTFNAMRTFNAAIREADKVMPLESDRTSQK